MIGSGAGAETRMRKQRIKRAGRKLDAEVKPIVWPELVQTPKGQNHGSRTRCGKNQKIDFNDARHTWAPPSLWEDSTQFVHVTGINPNIVGLPLAGILVISLWVYWRIQHRLLPEWLIRSFPSRFQTRAGVS
jgi:hypothetical protein